MDINYYEILGVNKFASDEEIKSAFKALAKKYHPDKNPDNKFYEEQFKKINQAYQVLSNSSKRFFYDIKLENNNAPHQAQARPAPPKPTFKKKTKAEYLKEKAMERRIWWLTGIGLLVVIIAGYSFYLFMNRYTSKMLLEEGIELESNKAYIAALEKYSEAMGYDKENTDAYLRRGLLRVKFMGDYTNGLADLNLAIKFSEEPNHNYYYQRAGLQAMLENYDEAINDLKNSLKIKPQFDSAYFAIAEIQNQVKENYDAALLQYAKAVEYNPKYAEAYFGKGICFFKMKVYDLAIENFDKAIHFNKSKGEWYSYRGQSYIQMNKKKKACADFALALDKGYHPAAKKIDKYCW